jgi:hypothetical protein
MLHSEPKPARAFYRRLNERLLDENATGRREGEVVAFFCECGAPDCSSWARLSVYELQAWLAEPSTSIVVRGHEGDDDDIVFATERYVVVDGS